VTIQTSAIIFKINSKLEKTLNNFQIKNSYDNLTPQLINIVCTSIVEKVDEK